MPTNQRFTCFVVFLTALTFVTTAPVRADNDEHASSKKETELLAVLRSDAPLAKKAITCKLLAIHGSSAAVPDLAELLRNPQLASWARIALEAIPGDAVDEALRQATDALDGILLVGTINSIGVRRDAKAVELLTMRLHDEDAEVASAAAVALGQIGNTAAAQSLRSELAAGPSQVSRQVSSQVRSAVAEGCILCAERVLAAGQSAEAAKIYDEVRQADVPKQRILEATRGAILARNDVPLLLEQFRSPDRGFFRLALSTAREFPGNQVDQALSDELGRAKPERAALLMLAMADRPQTVVLPAVLAAAEQGPKQVRLAAINALGRVGDATCLRSLLEIGLESDADLVRAAKTTLADLPGEKVDSQIVALLPGAEGKMVPLLIELVGKRRIDAISLLRKALDHSDSAVRQAALIALGETVTPDRLSLLIELVVTPKHRGDDAVATQALKVASVRMPNREVCAAELAKALERGSSVETKSALLRILGAVGGTEALNTVGTAARSADPELQDISSQLLGEWMTADAAPVLFDLAKAAPTEKYQIRALRGYIRIARQFNLPEQQRAEMCRKALEAAQRSAERKLVLGVLQRYPNAETLKLAFTAAQDPELKEQAAEVTRVIAQKLGASGNEVRELLSKAGLARVKLEIVKAEYGSGSTQTDVTAILRKHAGDLPLITLASTSYNATFGGDPLPGVPKQLKIQYRMNGKPGEASFAENALIILPAPK